MTEADTHALKLHVRPTRSFSLWCSLWILEKGHTFRPSALVWTPGVRGLGCTMFLDMQLQEGLLPTASPSTKLARLCGLPVQKLCVSFLNKLK